MARLITFLTSYVTTAHISHVLTYILTSIVLCCFEASLETSDERVQSGGAKEAALPA